MRLCGIVQQVLSIPGFWDMRIRRSIPRWELDDVRWLHSPGRHDVQGHGHHNRRSAIAELLNAAGRTVVSSCRGHVVESVMPDPQFGSG